MICEWGMSDLLGPLAFGRREEQIFLGREINRTTNYSEKTAELIDAELKRIVTENHQRARELLAARLDVLHRLAEALLEHESLDAEQIDAVMEGKPIPKPRAAEIASKNKGPEKEKAERAVFTPSLPPLKEDPEKA